MWTDKLHRTSELAALEDYLKTTFKVQEIQRTVCTLRRYLSGTHALNVGDIVLKIKPLLSETMRTPFHDRLLAIPHSSKDFRPIWVALCATVQPRYPLAEQLVAARSALAALQRTEAMCLDPTALDVHAWLQKVVDLLRLVDAMENTTAIDDHLVLRRLRTVSSPSPGQMVYPSIARLTSQLGPELVQQVNARGTGMAVSHMDFANRVIQAERHIMSIHTAMKGHSATHNTALVNALQQLNNTVEKELAAKVNSIVESRFRAEHDALQHSLPNIIAQHAPQVLALQSQVNDQEGAANGQRTDQSHGHPRAGRPDDTDTSGERQSRRERYDQSPHRGGSGYNNRLDRDHATHRLDRSASPGARPRDDHSPGRDRRDDTTRTRDRTCWKCHQEGHFASNCPQRRKEVLDNKTTGPPPGVCHYHWKGIPCPYFNRKPEGCRFRHDPLDVRCVTFDNGLPCQDCDFVHMT